MAEQPGEDGPLALAEHEAHGRCASCGYPAHRYPFGWEHVGTGMFACRTLTPVATCCDDPAHFGSNQPLEDQP